MTETDGKPGRAERKKPVKQGLHGWKAALAMFGCGSLAAFGVFGVVATILGIILSSFSSGIEGEGGGQAVPHDSANPREEFDGEKFDLCAIAEDVSGVNLDMKEEGNPEDSSLSGGEVEDDDLVRSDECSGVLTPSSSGESWQFDLSYRAIIYSPQGDEDDLAQIEFDDAVSRLGGGEGEISGADFLDQASYIYEISQERGARYSLASLKRSAILEIEITSPDQPSESAFFGELKQLERRFDVAIEANIPE